MDKERLISFETGGKIMLVAILMGITVVAIAVYVTRQQESPYRMSQKRLINVESQGAFLPVSGLAVGDELWFAWVGEDSVYVANPVNSYREKIASNVKVTALGIDGTSEIMAVADEDKVTVYSKSEDWRLVSTHYHRASAVTMSGGVIAIASEGAIHSYDYKGGYLGKTTFQDVVSDNFGHRMVMKKGMLLVGDDDQILVLALVENQLSLVQTLRGPGYGSMPFCIDPTGSRILVNGEGVLCHYSKQSRYEYAERQTFPRKGEIVEVKFSSRHACVVNRLNNGSTFTIYSLENNSLTENGSHVIATPDFGNSIHILPTDDLRMLVTDQSNGTIPMMAS